MKQHFRAEAVSSAAPAAVFRVLEAGDRWSEWAGLFVPRSHWAAAGDPPGTVGAVRRLGLGPLGSSERIVEHVPGKRLSYVVDSWQPYRGYRADVDLVPTTDGGTRIVWQASFEPLLPGTGALLRLGLRRLVAGFARNLARAAERAR
ncbi:MAG: SRPBCC family protein [Mycobacteriales bacterium]